MNRRTFLGWTAGLLAGLGGLFGSKRASGATPEPKVAPRASQGDFQFTEVSWVNEGGEPIRKPGCKCHWEEGDSPCPVHGMDEEAVSHEHVLETDFWEMCDHIVEHVGRTGEPVLSYDEPHRLTLGFACDTKTWQIKVFGPLDLGRSLDRKPEKAEIVRPFLRTQEGRIKLAAALQGSGMTRYRLGPKGIAGPVSRE
jgi:hypothetical protein